MEEGKIKWREMIGAHWGRRGPTPLPRNRSLPVSSGDDYACQPWASRTAIISLRMLFHVEGSIITSFGNMQPSQQMCWYFCSGLPYESRSQCEACFAIDSFPLGSFGRQCLPVLSCEPEPFTVASFWATWKSIVQGRRAAVSVARARSSV